MAGDNIKCPLLKINMKTSFMLKMQAQEKEILDGPRGEYIWRKHP